MIADNPETGLCPPGTLAGQDSLIQQGGQPAREEPGP
jgi:hypothetical protein